MRDYATIRSRFWTHGTGKALRDDPLARLLAVYLMSCPNSTMTGIYYLPIPTLAHELGCSTEGAWKALQRVIDEGFASYDEDDELVFVHGLAREQVGRELKPGDKRRKALLDQLEKWASHRFFWGFVQLYGDPYGLPYDVKQCPFESPLKPLRSQRTESSRTESREQDQVSSPSGDSSESRLSGVLTLSDHSSAPNASKRDSDVTKVFEHWKSKVWNGRGPEPKLDGKRKSRISARLREGLTVEQLCQAVEGALRSPWHTGDNPTGKTYLGIQTLLRDRETVEGHIERVTAPAQRPGVRALTPDEFEVDEDPMEASYG